MPENSHAERISAEGQGPTRRSAPSPRSPRGAPPRQMRDRAVFALLFLTGVRVAALVSLKVKHINLAETSVMQDPREVATKFGKRIDTFFAKGFGDAEEALRAWMIHLDEVAFYGPDAPLFPAPVPGHRRRGPVQRRLQARRVPAPRLAEYRARPQDRVPGFRRCRPAQLRTSRLSPHARPPRRADVAEFVANAQNLGHTDVRTTLRSYGQLSRERQRELVTGETDT